ncbi:MAG: ATP-binding protein, partial [bacterium]
MRYLNKIIFIHSARIRYAEINLNGNVHFIGTQGVGKSTLLRAILFFYNADTFGLGIPRQKSSFTDYYFKDPNAYIIYEMVRDDGKFCVVSYNSQHKVCFRFFDGEYKKEYFISENGNVPEWEGIAERLDRFKVFYTKRKIDEHKEYRDILYGNNDGKKHELKRYSLLESKDYQYIPKTIQNVFLNSKMEAEFIKQTIIMSLDNDFRIDLNQHAHHLNGFESQLNDIRKFKTPSATAQADSISKLYIAINSLEREKIKTAKQLAWALKKIEEEEPKLSKRLETQEGHKNVLATKLNKLAEIFKAKENKLRADIGVYENNLKKAKQLNEDYQKININEIIARVVKKSDQEREQKSLLQEKDLLTSQFKELEHKYLAILNQLENQFKEFINSKESEKNQIQAEFLSFKDEKRRLYDKQIAELRVKNRSETEQARELWEHKKRETQKLKIDREGIKHKRFYEDEIKKNDKNINTFTDKKKELSAQNFNSSREIETFQKNWDIDDKEIQKNFNGDIERINGQISEQNKKISKIETYIENSKSSLYGWLTAHYPGWENTIGKVIKENTNVLFNTALSPKLAEKPGNFYGIEIDLNEINETVKT